MPVNAPGARVSRALRLDMRAFVSDPAADSRDINDARPVIAGARRRAGMDPRNALDSLQLAHGPRDVPPEPIPPDREAAVLVGSMRAPHCPTCSRITEVWYDHAGLLREACHHCRREWVVPRRAPTAEEQESVLRRKGRPHPYRARPGKASDSIDSTATLVAVPPFAHTAA